MIDPDVDGTTTPTPTGPRPVVFGLLGGIASGKSAVGRLLVGPGGCVIAADDLAHEVLASPELREWLRSRFGEAAFDAEGQVDRAFLAQRVFAEPELRRELEGWIHPRVRAKILAALERAHRDALECVALDVPLLLENDEQHGLVARCDHLVFVDAPAAARDERAVQNRGWSPGEVARREAAQLPLEEKRRRADCVLTNDGDLEALAEEVRAYRVSLGLPEHPPSE